MADSAPFRIPAAALRNAAGAFVALSAIPFFGWHAPLLGGLMLLVGVSLGFAAGPAVGFDVLPVAVGIGLLTFLPDEPALGFATMAQFTVVLAAALLVPWLISRFAPHGGGVSFAFRDGQRWGKVQWIFLALVPLIGYLVLPLYFIGAEGHLNWPELDTAGAVVLLAVAILSLGLWEELFFVGVVYEEMRRHMKASMAIILRAAVVVPLLADWGFTGPGIMVILVFSLVQGLIYERTRSLSYVIAVHLLFDVIMIAVLIYAKNPQWPDIFLTA